MNSSDYLDELGYFTFAINSEKVDYLKLAYLQGLSIKASQKNNRYAVAIPKNTYVPDKYREVIDHFIEFVPFNGHAFSNECLAYQLSPFKYTFKLDVDLILTSDISHYHGLYQKYDLLPTLSAKSYRGTTYKGDYYRKLFTKNKLPNTYSAFTYFKKSDLAKSFFNIVKEMMDLYPSIKNDLLENSIYNELPTDEAYGLASKYLDIQYPTEILSFVHMKKYIQDINTGILTDNWLFHLKSYFDKNMNFYIEEFLQTLPFHYHVKEFASNKVISKYEKFLGI